MGQDQDRGKHANSVLKVLLADVKKTKNTFKMRRDTACYLAVKKLWVQVSLSYRSHMQDNELEYYMQHQT